MPTFRQDNKLGSKVSLIKTCDINDKAITSDKIANSAIDADKIQNGSITKEKLAPDVDLSLYILVDEFPSENINPNKIYLKRDSPLSETYTKFQYVNGEWKNLGVFNDSINLSAYIPYSGMGTLVEDNFGSKEETNEESKETAMQLHLEYKDENSETKKSGSVNIPSASYEKAGLMSAKDKQKVDALYNMSALTEEELNKILK